MCRSRILLPLHLAHKGACLQRLEPKCHGALAGPVLELAELLIAEPDSLTEQGLLGGCGGFLDGGLCERVLVLVLVPRLLRQRGSLGGVEHLLRDVEGALHPLPERVFLVDEAHRGWWFVRRGVCCGVHSPVRHQKDPIRYDTIRYDSIRYDTIRYDTIRYRRKDMYLLHTLDQYSMDMDVLYVHTYVRTTVTVLGILPPGKCQESSHPMSVTRAAYHMRRKGRSPLLLLIMGNNDVRTLRFFPFQC